MYRDPLAGPIKSPKSLADAAIHPLDTVTSSRYKSAFLKKYCFCMVCLYAFCAINIAVIWYTLQTNKKSKKILCVRLSKYYDNMIWDCLLLTGNDVIATKPKSTRVFAGH